MPRLLIGLLLLALPQVSSQSGDRLALSPSVAQHIVDSLSEEYYNSKFALYPAYATSKGIHTYDGTLSAFAPLKVRKFLLQTKFMVNTLSSFSEDSLSIEDWIDMKALRADMENQVLLLEDLQVYARSPLVYTGACTDGLYYLAIRNKEVWADSNFTSRLREVPRVLEAARKNLTRPIKLHCEVAAAGARAFLPFLEGISDAARRAGTPLDSAVVGKAQASLEQFAAYLDSLGPKADPQFALGYENFTRLLGARHLVDERPEDLLAYADRVLEDAKARRAAIGSPQAPKPDSAAARLLTKGDILATFSREADSAKAFLERNAIVTIPPGSEVVPVETPGFVKVLTPGYAYEPPGPFDRDQTGLLYVPLPDQFTPEDRLRYEQTIERRGFKGTVVHELYPGHHLQLVCANRLPSKIRKLADDNFTIEGWALYCEEMMADQGYFGPDGARRTLGGIIFRAARVIVDIKLQLGQFSLAQAVDFMVKETGGDRDFLEQEVRRYAVDPTQPMSYLIGKRDLISLRDEYRRIRGKDFSLLEFHDALLERGSLPPYLVRVSVISELMGRQ